MAYPGEKEHVRYTEYSMKTAEGGQRPLSKDEWRRTVDKPTSAWDDLKVDNAKGNRKNIYRMKK